MNKIVSAAVALAVAGAFGLGTLAISPVLAQDQPMAKEMKDGKKAGKKAGKAAANKSVMALQEALNKSGATLKVDGRMGKNTRAALKDFQSKNGLKATGKLDKASRAKLGM
jgi:peptidoglycan hydrolase-like protein with peptidoglycan-binding domain